SSALIGSGGHCDVRLPPDHVAVEQLLLEIQPGGLFAEARARTPQVTVDGVPFQRGRVLPERDFKVGPITIHAELAQAKVKKQSEQRVRPRVLVLAALVLPIGAFMAFNPQNAEADTDYKSAPPLFDSTPPACAEQSEAAATSAVESWLRDAEGRHERAPFSPEDAVQAVHLYRKSASCLEKFGRAAPASELRDGADGLAHRLERDFHVHRVRLARALAADDVDAARHEVALLRGYLPRGQSDFALWLDYLDRKLGLRSNEKGRKK
ncbi:MAG TPA: FHA domain-containing protein, partial [Polyangiaceae bacterium]|nr:FHA domain-containing protein [Polyangiaceae bacterium]